jgi:hypothetical protein
VIARGKSRLSNYAGLQVIALISITFAAAQWGSQGVKFGVSLLLVALIAFLLGERMARSKLEGCDAAWMEALQYEERFRRKKAAALKHIDIERAVQWERGAGAVQMASQAALARVREGR